MKRFIEIFTDEDFLSEFIIFKIKSFAVIGLYSKHNHNKIKRIFHYLPVMVTILKKN